MVASLLRTMNPVRPLTTSGPPSEDVSAMSTVTFAVGLEDVAKTDRDATECAATARSSVVTTGDGAASGTFVPALKDAQPPGGWFWITSRKVLSKFDMFCAATTKARCNVVESGFEFWGEEKMKSCVMRAP